MSFTSGLSHRRLVRRSLTTVVVGSMLVVGAGLGSSAFAGSTTPGAPRTITGKITDSKSATHAPTSKACVYPFYVYNDATSAMVKDSYLPTQLMAESAAACSDNSGNYSVSVPPAVADGVSLKAVVVSDTPILVSKVIDFPSSGTTLDIALDPSASNVQAVITRNGQTWANGIALVTDHATGQFLGAAKTNYNYIPKDPDYHFYAGVDLAVDTAVDVHYLVPGAAISSDVQPTLSAIAQVGINKDLGTVELGSLAEVTGHVTLDGTKPAPYQTVAAECTPPAQTPCGTLGVTNANGAFTFWVQPDKTYVYSYGGTKVRAKFAGGSGAELPSLRLVPAGAPAAAYRVAPRTWFGSRPAVTLTGQATFTWTGGAPESAPLVWARSQATGTWNKGLGAYSAAVYDYTQTRTVKLANGVSSCTKVNTTTFVAPLTAAENSAFVTQCQTAPLDDRAAAASKFRRVASAGAFGKTLSVATAKGATLTLSGATGHQVSVVFARAGNGGSFTVSVAGRVLKTVSTKGSTAAKQIVYLPVKTMKGAKVVITTTSAAPVSIDGIAVLP